jgi:hypothetical protein
MWYAVPRCCANGAEYVVRQRAALMPAVVKKLQWNSSPALLSALEAASLSCSKLISESDLHVFEFTGRRASMPYCLFVCFRAFFVRQG